jgi:hypothetical protein
MTRPTASPTPTPPPPLPPDVQQALQAGRTIDAIRQMRELTGMGLREAKALIDAAQAEQTGRGTAGSPSAQRHRPVEEPGWRSRPGWIVVLLLVLVFIGWWLSQRA